MRLLVIALLCLHLLAPISAWAQAAAAKSPLETPLKTYGFMLGVALLGGLVSWFAKVKRGEIAAFNIMHLVGELSTSAFAGLLAFWLCEAAGMSSMWTAPLVGIAGHMGTRAIAMFEEAARKRYGVDKDPNAAQ